jgi:phosphate transport system permease protein
MRSATIAALSPRLGEGMIEAFLLRQRRPLRSLDHRRDRRSLVAERISRALFTNRRSPPWSSDRHQRQPHIEEFGILPLLTSTVLTSTIAMIVALPLGIGVAIYLSEYASRRARSILKPTLEVLAGIPTVVFGYFALTFMTPILRSVLGRDTVEIYNMASGGIVIGILVLPLVSSMCEDALSAVPRSLREAGLALGTTKLETALRIVVPGAFSGIMAAFIVGISRAIGETMVVALAVGAGPNFTFNPFRGAETMTGHIVRISTGDLSYDSIDYNSIFAIALALFFMTLTLNVISQAIVRRYREKYE